MQNNSHLESVELMIAKFLRYGVMLAGFVLLVGWAMQIDFHHNVFAQFTNYVHVPLTEALSVAWANQQWGLLISYLGLVILIALPFTRVMLTAIVFLIDRDYIMAACAILVIIGLLLSVRLGF